MAIKLSDKFSYKKLIAFTIPSILMMIFTSIYTIVDGFFISNFVGELEFAAVNFIWPVLIIIGAVGFMFGTGGSALVAKILGEGNKEKANRIFTALVILVIIIGIILATLGIFFIKPIELLLGAEKDDPMLPYCTLYGRVLLCALPFFILQYLFQCFFITAEKPKLGLIVTLIAGVANMVLDALFMAVLNMGVLGAALATAVSQVIGGVIPLIYFSVKNSSLLRFVKPKFELKSIVKAITNGSSEFVSNISVSLVSIIYNYQLLKFYEGDSDSNIGIIAYGTFAYISMIFTAIFIGYTTGVAPIIGYNYGAGNSKELKNIFKKSMVIIIISSIAMLIFGELLSSPFAYIFTGKNEEIFELTKHAIRVCSLSFVFVGICIFASGFFTALNNGLVSALISMIRTLGIQTLTIIILPLIIGKEGIWLSVMISELIASIMSIIFIIKNKKKYNY